MPTVPNGRLLQPAVRGLSSPGRTNSFCRRRPNDFSTSAPAGLAPKGARILLDEKGKHSFLSMAGEQIDWPVEGGVVTSTPKKNHIVSKLHFRDADIHVEFLLPKKGPGNSGVYIHGNYGVQIVNSFGKEKFTQNDAAALYGFSAARESLPQARRMAGVRHPVPRPAAGRRRQDHRERDRYRVVQREEGSGRCSARRTEIDVPPVPVRQPPRT